MSGLEDANAPRRKYHSPYTASHTIPTITGYQQEKEQRREAAGVSDDEDQRSYKQQAKDAYADYKARKDGQTPATNPNTDESGRNKINGYDAGFTKEEDRKAAREPDEVSDEEAEDAELKDTSQTSGFEEDPKARRKQLKHRKGDRADREVTDPITHLPVRIHDFTDKELGDIPENDNAERLVSDLNTTANRDDDVLEQDHRELRRGERGMQNLFPPPQFGQVKQQVANVQRYALLVGFGLILTTLMSMTIFDRYFGISEGIERMIFSEKSQGKILSTISIFAVGAVVGAGIIWLMTEWANKKIEDVWEGELWAAERQQGKERIKSDEPETTQWLNSLMGSIWPLINPDLFISLADTLEDVMQASLPKLVRMVSVDDIGQGSEALRLLGVKWLPHGAAAQAVTESGKLEKRKSGSVNASDRSVPGEGRVSREQELNEDNEPKGSEKARKQRRQDEEENEAVAEGLEAEEGDFVNMELAFAYRARVEGKRLRDRAKNAHLYLAFYMPGNLKLPVWVELRGLVGTVRVRFQLTPDPPFISLCTLSFMGQPKVDISCVPLFKRALNIMDLPIISNFVQSSVDAAMAEYVAPKSLTLNLKDMLVGDDFKKDTSARGILMIRIKYAFDFKEGDPGFGPIKKGGTDGYVSIGWAKFGKAVWSTRVILSDMHPYWEETGFLLVTPQELNVDERLRIQLWDSDRFTADDDLGRIEIDLKDLMRDERSNGKIWDRTDGFHALKAGEEMPGKLAWSVGYFSKTRVLDSQLKKQDIMPGVNSLADLKRQVNKESERKLREAVDIKGEEQAEIDQQKAQDFKERQDELIIASPPSEEYPSGILSIVVHQITGLELEPINKRQAQKHETEDDQQEEGDDLPSAYCTIILNHQKIFKTRTKPKNAKPFFNAGCERFIRDWRTAHIHVTARDARVHEEDALLGLVHLPLKDVFKNRSQIDETYPLAGGIGYGRVRISMVFRSVQLQAPRELLGWEYGTLDIRHDVHGINLPSDIQGCKIKARTKVSKGKFKAAGSSESAEGGCVWKAKHCHPLRLAVRKRYSSCLVLEFHSKASLVGDKIVAFAILWLQDLIDEEEKTVRLKVFKGDLKRAEVNVLPDEDLGEHLGDIELKVTFWSGLSGYHVGLAKSDANLRDVMQALDAANDIDSNDGVDSDDGDGSASEADSSASEDEGLSHTATNKTSPSFNEGDMEERKKKFREDHKKTEQSELSEDGKRGPIDQLKDYKQHQSQLHRRNRGLMQWKAPRTIKWAVNKVERAEQKITGMFHHHTRETGIETEV